MSDAGPRELNPLVKRVDTLLKRRLASTQHADEEVPILTEIVDAESSTVPPAPVLDETAAQALAAELERAVLERIDPELERIVERRLSRSIPGLLEHMLRELRAELAISVRQTAREAVATAVTRARVPREPQQGEPEGGKP